MDHKITELQKRLAALNKRSDFALVAPSAMASAQHGAIDALQSAFANVSALETVNPGTAALEEIQSLAADTDTAIATLHSKLDGIAATSKGIAESAATTDAALETKITFARREFNEKITEIAEALQGLEGRFAQSDRLNPCGCYDPKRTYNRLDLVELKGSSYISLEDDNREKPGKNSKKWMLSAGKGASIAFGGGGGTVINQGFNVIAEDEDSITIEI